MCLILFAWQAHPEYPLVLVANRDELHDRPTAPAAFQEEGWLGGRDLLAQGTWLGITRGGRFAAVTNYRERPLAEGERSRGDLVRGFLESDQDPVGYLDRLELDAFAGFNLLVGDRDVLAYVSNRGETRRALEPGVYGVSNHLLDTPWPKVLGGKAALQAFLVEGLDPSALLELAADREVAPDPQLPDTGVGLEVERHLAPRFIVTPRYGTRCTSLVLVDDRGQVTFVERSFAADGTATGTINHTFALEPAPA